jgi:hypothetical protein
MKFATLLLLTLALLGQDRPRIASIRTLPSDPIPSGPWSCKSGSAGYLEERGGRTDLSDAELGQTVAAYLRDGYTATIYPKTKNGIFVDLECNAVAIQKPTSPK